MAKLLVPETKPDRNFENEIFISNKEGWASCFPKDIRSIEIRKYAEPPTSLESFEKAVRKAVNRVWLMDDYIFMPEGDKENKQKLIENRLLTIIEWFPTDITASDIRILTKSHNEVCEYHLKLFKYREQEINNYRNKGSTQCNIEINTNLSKNFNYIHDRFAIVDDELWHFGATVGGFHASVTATSRGWSALDTGAIDFFELVWAKCLENNR